MQIIDVLMLQEDQRTTGILVFSVFVAVIGNSFLYGYNIGVVNTPSLVGGCLLILCRTLQCLCFCFLISFLCASFA